jgi:polysaccharide deacetylase 2 family uncharacterized protein YibQ
MEKSGQEQEASLPVAQPVIEQTIVFEEPDLPQPQDAQLTNLVEVDDSAITESPARENRPMVAIIIDDMGYHQQIGNQLLALDMNLSFSFLPGAPFTLEQEDRAWQQGRDVMLHMPMEPHDPSWDLGPGGLYLKYSPLQIRATVQENLTAVPHAIGANNHMGSKFTEDAAAMREVLGILKQRGFFFVDSYTTAKSTGLAEAGKMKIPTARRHVFLDNVHEEEKICGQLKQLVALAKENGWAIGIGHPNQATLSALTNCRERLLKNVEIVGVSRLVE